MIRTVAAAAALFASTLAAAPASAAVTLDFDAVRGRNGNTGYVYGPYQEDGFTLSADRCSSQNTCFVTTGTTLTSLDRVGAALTNMMGSAVSTLRANNGSAFSLLGLDMAGNYGNFSGFSPETLGVTFTFNFADGTTETRALTLANTAGQRLTVNPLDFSSLAPLTSVSWKPGSNTSGFLQFDNIRVEALSAVPEPATWALMLLGFGAIGGTLRRRRPVPKFA